MNEKEWPQFHASYEKQTHKIRKAISIPRIVAGKMLSNAEKKCKANVLKVVAKVFQENLFGNSQRQSIEAWARAYSEYTTSFEEILSQHVEEMQRVTSVLDAEWKKTSHEKESHENSDSNDVVT